MRTQGWPQPDIYPGQMIHMHQGHYTGDRNRPHRGDAHDVDTYIELAEGTAMAPPREFGQTRRVHRDHQQAYKQSSIGII
eukprot:4830932-Karenia_brevis.AAC.1